MAKQAQKVVETLGLIAQVQAEYQAIVEEVRGYCQKARELRQQVDELKRSGSTDPNVATEVRKLLEQADYYNHLADQKDGHPRLEILRRIDSLVREASGLRETVQHNENVLARQQMELEETEREAVLMVKRAKEQIQETEQLLESQRAKLTELEGNRVE
ncbi:MULTISPECIES: hypothetical protein [Brevibacillus]|uniref:hypothetical protein n=1 Tax=Brevibacillus TaxID=55080 RepID=UPI001C235FF2|nr:hypothetical protein [Brevibacillus parabrevis]MBU8714604.1 hypothetical protein [Brevibacillus parabrevis]MED2254681.1 hypothetical protein [Brevibacillus parabrevis]WDV94069.1 hypothetical protein PSE45_20855 [Brevibacillus parabrevis]